MGTKEGAGTGPDVKQLCRLLGDLGHEVATPLASILLTSEMLADNTQGNLTERQVRSLQNLIRATDEIQILMKRVVLLTRLATRQLEFDQGPFSLEELVEELAAAHPAVKVSMVPPLPATFTSDRMRLYELIELMLEVALRLDPAPELRVAGSPTGGVSFTVGAIGALSEEQKARAFDPFGAGLKVARHGGGSGLELAIVDRLILALDGNFEIADHPGGKLSLDASFPLPPA